MSETTPDGWFTSRYEIVGRITDTALYREVPVLDVRGRRLSIWRVRRHLLPTEAERGLFELHTMAIVGDLLPGVLPILDYGALDGQVWLCVPPVPRAHEIILRLHAGRPDPVAALGAARQLAPILAGLAVAGRVHGCLLPRDLLAVNGRLMVAGSELWRLLARAPLLDALGSDARHLPPETRAGSAPGPAADVYALASLCARLALGTNAIGEELQRELGRKLPRLGAVLGDALSTAPDARPDDPIALVRDIDDAMAAQPRTLMPPRRPDIGTEWDTFERNDTGEEGAFDFDVAKLFATSR